LYRRCFCALLLSHHCLPFAAAVVLSISVAAEEEEEEEGEGEGEEEEEEDAARQHHFEQTVGDVAGCSSPFIVCLFCRFICVGLL
jgi:hypothetical protein